jgi:hypothetical protein
LPCSSSLKAYIPRIAQQEASGLFLSKKDHPNLIVVSPDAENRIDAYEVVAFRVSDISRQFVGLHIFSVREYETAINRKFFLKNNFRCDNLAF